MREKIILFKSTKTNFEMLWMTWQNNIENVEIQLENHEFENFKLFRSTFISLFMESLSKQN